MAAEGGKGNTGQEKQEPWHGSSSPHGNSPFSYFMVSQNVLWFPHLKKGHTDTSQDCYKALS